VQKEKNLQPYIPNYRGESSDDQRRCESFTWFSDNTIKTNCTLVFFCRPGKSLREGRERFIFHPNLIGRIDDGVVGCVQLIEQIAGIYTIQGFDTEYLRRPFAAHCISSNSQKPARTYGTFPLESIRVVETPAEQTSGLQNFLPI